MAIGISKDAALTMFNLRNSETEKIARTHNSRISRAPLPLKHIGKHGSGSRYRENFVWPLKTMLPVPRV